MATHIPVSEADEQVDTPSRPPGAAAVSIKDDEISVLDLLIVLAERKRTIFLVTIASAILAIIVSFLLPTRYTATVTLLPPQQNSSLSAQLSAQLGAMGGAVASLAGGSSLLKNPNEMYVSMLRSRVVEDAMIDHFSLMSEYHERYLSETRKAFERHASVDGSGKDGLIYISVDDHDPRRAADLANGYVDQFRNLSENLAITEAGQRRLFFEKQLDQANHNLADAEAALTEMEKRTGLIELNSQARALIESAAALRAQITAKEVQIQGMQTYATGENSQMVQAQRELDSMRAQLAKLGGAGDNSDGIIVPKGQMTEAGVEYARRLRDVKYYETIFEILARQFEMAKLDEAKEGALIQIVDPAIPPDRRSFPKRTLIVLGAIAVGFILGLFTSLLQAGFARAKNDPDVSMKLHFLRAALTFRRPRSA